MKKTKDDAPFLNSWKNLYWFVVGNLVVMIFFFYLITRYFK